MIEITDEMRAAKAAAIALLERLAAEGFDQERDWGDTLATFDGLSGPATMVWCMTASRRAAMGDYERLHPTDERRPPTTPATLNQWNSMAAKDPRFVAAMRRHHEWKGGLGDDIRVVADKLRTFVEAP